MFHYSKSDARYACIGKGVFMGGTQDLGSFVWDRISIVGHLALARSRAQQFRSLPSDAGHLLYEDRWACKHHLAMGTASELKLSHLLRDSAN